MAKITYFLGAGASYNSCPILNQQANMMIALAQYELTKKSYNAQVYNGISVRAKSNKEYKFIKEELYNLTDEKDQILWHIGYFGLKAIEFNTVDTYAKKLFLTKQFQELRLLKMSVSIFFDLWENFYEERYTNLCDNKYRTIDNRYTSLFSLLLENDENGKIKMNNEFNFITWNYDLQLEKTFKSFLNDNDIKNFDELDRSFFKFKEEDDLTSKNKVFHLNGHRGFFKDKDKIFELNTTNDFESYWSQINGLFELTKNGSANFDQYIKYSWEHNLNSQFYQKINNIMRQTEVLIIIGYSFPPFNREVDQMLFSKLSNNQLKKIVYQDPNANKTMIENLFEKPYQYKSKIEIVTESSALNQFYLPNEHFITQRPQGFSGVNYI